MIWKQSFQNVDIDSDLDYWVVQPWLLVRTINLWLALSKIYKEEISLY